MKEVQAKGVYPDQWEIYKDGSASAYCIECGSWRTMPPATFERFSKIYWGFEHWNKHFKCTQCFIQSKKAGELINKPMENKDDRIAYAQAFNLAVALIANDAKVSSLEPNGVGENKVKGRIEHWQQWFYEKLTNRN